MHTAEKLVFAIRHNRHLEGAQWIWNGVRPIYDRLLSRMGRGGLKRTINGSDSILVAPRWRMIGEEYEPDVWRRLMSEVRPGDVVADVGAYVGLYTVAFAKRVAPTGQVFAFEPECANYRALKEHIDLNGVSDRVKLVQAAAAERDGFATMESNLDSSYITGVVATDTPDESAAVRCMTLDRFFAENKMDLLKIDVEGHEEKVLEGAKGLLSDPSRRPRAIFIEVHPYAWPRLGTTSESLLRLLAKFNYQVQDLSGNPIKRITQYGEVVAITTH
jgi:FkbM family methyltransferase